MAIAHASDADFHVPLAEMTTSDLVRVLKDTLDDDRPLDESLVFELANRALEAGQSAASTPENGLPVHKSRIADDPATPIHLVKGKRLYAETPAVKLADILEAQWGVEPLDEEIVGELLNRSLEAEGAVEKSKYVEHF